jgi:hypothetical protein
MTNVEKGKYLRFDLLEQKRKTSVYKVISKTQGATLGYIQWYGVWRQYCFYPTADTVFSEGCLYEITFFMCELKSAHKENRNVNEQIAEGV